MLLVTKLNGIIADKIEQSGMPYFIFAVFGLVNYPASYLYWHFMNSNGYENLSLRLIATVLCLLLVLKPAWPQRINQYFPLYWYCTVLFCIPVFGTFMSLSNHFSSQWLMNMLLGLYWFVLLVDWESFVSMLVLGIVFGCILFAIDGGNFNQITHDEWYGAIYMYLFALLIGGLFSRKNYLIKKLQIQKEKFSKNLAEDRAEYNQQIAASIAHELRTPLATVKLCANGIKQYVNALLQSYQIAKDNKLPVPVIDNLVLTTIPENLDAINLEADSAFVFIDMLLMNVNQQEFGKNLSVCSMRHCVEAALGRYPFKGNEKASIHFDVANEDFQFNGNEMLIVHVFFNLIKNALYYIAAKPTSGQINISTKRGTPNKLYFKDTGTGIAKDVLPHIFDRFFSRTRHGTGIGLAFCKMVIEAFGGKISCNSIEGEYTEFVIELPPIN